jgi:hypothetical protein
MESTDAAEQHEQTSVILMANQDLGAAVALRYFQRRLAAC